MVYKIGNFSPNTNLSTMLFFLSLYTATGKKRAMLELKKARGRRKTAMFQNANDEKKTFN